MLPRPLALVFHLLLLLPALRGQQGIQRRVGSMQEVFAWTQITYDINGQQVLSDRFAAVEEGESPGPGRDQYNEERLKRQARDRDRVFVNENQGGWVGNNRPNQQRPTPPPPSWWTESTTSTTQRPSNESGSFFIQYNNVPTGAERVGNRLFVALPRRRFGIPATLNYLDLRVDSAKRSPSLRPYPDLRQGSQLVSVYRTRADVCGRLWMVDTGLLEIPNNRRQVQPPAIVVFDLRTNRQLLRYPFKGSDLVSADTPTGLSSITVDVTADDCAGAVAYVPDLTTNGIIVFSLRERDSWRHQHNYFHFSPTASTLNVAGQRFQWSDGIFSLTLGPVTGGCRTAYFHPLISHQEFTVSTCVLRNRNASQASDYWTQFNLLGERGIDTQSTMHDFHEPTGVVFFAEIGRNAVSCWRSTQPLRTSNMAIVAQNSQRMSYPSDLHVTGDEVWVIANGLPRFGYSRYDTSQYNFFIYRGSVQEMIRNTPCANGLMLTASNSSESITFREPAVGDMNQLTFAN